MDIADFGWEVVFAKHPEGAEYLGPGHPVHSSIEG
jgi:hypothetical protein